MGWCIAFQLGDGPKFVVFWIYIFIWSSIYCCYFVHIFLVFQKTGDWMNRLPNSIYIYVYIYIYLLYTYDIYFFFFIYYIYVVLHLPFISHQYFPSKKNRVRGDITEEPPARRLAPQCAVSPTAVASWRNIHRRGMALQNLNYIRYYIIKYN